MTLGLILAVAFGCWLAERWWPASELPRVRAWYPRVALVNPVHFRPTCTGCSKRWACQEARGRESHGGA